MIFKTCRTDFTGEEITLDEDEILVQMDEFDLVGMVARSSLDLDLIVSLLMAYQNHEIHKEQK